MEKVRIFVCYFLMFIKITTSTALQTRKGIKLCEDDCFHAGGCKGFQFDHVHLQCDLEDKNRDRSPQWSAHLLMNNMQKTPKVRGTSTCSTGERCIKTRRGKSVCVQTQVVKSRGNSRHLLILSSNSVSRSQIQMYKLNLGTWVIEKHILFRLKHVLTLLYMDKAGKLLISTSIPRRIQFYELDGKKLDILMNGVRALAMTHDEGRQLVFFMGFFDRNKIKRLSVITKELKILHVALGRLLSGDFLAVDCSRETLYAINNVYKIVSISYEGNNVTTICDRPGIHSLLFDDVDNTLYYADMNSIYKRTRSENQESLVSKTGVFFGFEIYEHKLYAGSKDTGKLYIVDVTTRNVSQKALPHKWMKLCVIPL